MRFKTPILQSTLLLTIGVFLGITISSQYAEAQPRRNPSVQRPTAPTRPQGARDTEIKSTVKSEAVRSQAQLPVNKTQSSAQHNIDALAMMLLNNNDTTSMLNQTITSTNPNGVGRYQISSWANEDFAGYFILDTQTGMLFDNAKFAIDTIKTIAKSESPN